MLKQWNAHGYELMKKMTAFGLAAMNPGRFYRILRQMEKDGMVCSKWDAFEGVQRGVSTRSRRLAILISSSGASPSPIPEDDEYFLSALYWSVSTDKKDEQ